MNKNSPAMKPDLLHRTSRLYGVQTTYCDGLKQPRQAPMEATIRVLQALGAPVSGPEDLADAYRAKRQARWQIVVEPVTVVWQTHPLQLKIRVPGQLAETPSAYRIVLESGAVVDGELRDDPAFARSARRVEGAAYVARRLLGPGNLPFGYHRLYLRIGELEVESFLISAPLHAYTQEKRTAKRWGLFCPLYALRSEHSWGVGDFSDLDQLGEFTAAQGGDRKSTRLNSSH